MSALVALAYLSLFALSILDNFRGPFYPEILRDLNLGPAQGSLFFATMSFFAFLGSWRLHGFLRRHSAVHLMSATSVFLGIGFAAMSAAPDFYPLLAACALFGFAFGGMNLAQNVLVGEAADGSTRRKLFAGLHAMYGLASLCAPLLATVYRDHGLSWRAAFASASVLPLLLGAWSWNLQKLGKQEHSDAAAMPMDAVEWRHCLIFGLMLAAYLWGELSVSSRLVLWLRADRGFAPDRADQYLSLFFATLLAGRLLFGFWNVEKIGNRNVLLVSAGLATLLYSLGLSYDPLFLVASGFVMAPFYPVLMDEVARHFGRKGSEAMGFIIGSGSGSVVLMHILIGQVNARWGITSALAMCAAALGFLAVILLVWRFAATGVGRGSKHQA